MGDELLQLVTQPIRGGSPKQLASGQWQQAYSSMFRLAAGNKQFARQSSLQLRATAAAVRTQASRERMADVTDKAVLGKSSAGRKQSQGELVQAALVRSREKLVDIGINLGHDSFDKVGID
jgi:hypothetical protein